MTRDLPTELTPFADLLDGFDVRAHRRISGGDIANAYRLETPDGPVFAKTLERSTPGLFEREALGLKALRDSVPSVIRVPRVLAHTDGGLVLEWIEEGRRGGRRTEEDLGHGLAVMHLTSNDFFGGLDGNAHGYLGSAEVDLTPATDWPEFFVERRIAPLVGRAVSEGRIDPSAHEVLGRLRPRAAELCGPAEPPALLHGDLWAGNRLVDTKGVNWLIDPAAHWGHREYDLAMMQLFGGFGGECFAAYHATEPLERNWRERTRWYQVPPLLVHAVLFGGSYGSAALAAMNAYL